MSRPFLVKDIAQQAGVSTATVDRVLNGRPHVRQHMVRRVEQAIGALERQRQQVGVIGRKFMIDLVMDTPDRFSRLVREALEDEMETLRPAVLRARYELRDEWPAAGVAEALERIGARGSHGVLLKAADTPEVVRAVDRLAARGIPVVTVVTDLPLSRRIGYAGLDNRAAGRTAAYLIGRWLGPTRRAGVLVSLSSTRFRGEEEREIAFRHAVREFTPRLGIHETTGGLGLPDRTVRLVAAMLRAHPDIAAVYSAGGANEAILEAFRQARRTCRVFIGHDLDDENLALLRASRVHAVLHHDLRQDMRRACALVLGTHGVGGVPAAAGPTPVDIVTPFNLPPSGGAPRRR